MAASITKQTKITIGLLLGLLLSSLDQTIISTAMPTVTQSLGGFSLYSWVFTVYMLASTTTMPVYGKLADLFGRKKLYIIGMLLFLIGSALCGIAGTMTELIVFRAIQGLGAGAIMPLSMTIVADIYEPEKRGRFMGLFGSVFALTSIAGPALGGLIVEHWSWGWIFFMNLPIGVISVYIIASSLNESKSTEKRAIDVLGTAVLTCSIVAILLALALGGSAQDAQAHYEWLSAPVGGLFALELPAARLVYPHRDKSKGADYSASSV